MFIIGIAVAMGILITPITGLATGCAIVLFVRLCTDKFNLYYLKTAQDESFKQFADEHKKLLIGIIAYSVIAYPYLIYKLIKGGEASSASDPIYLVLIFMSPWLALCFWHQAYLFKRLKDNT